MATAGSSRKLRRGFPGVSIPQQRLLHLRTTSRVHFGVRRLLTASTRKRTGQRDANWPDWYAAYMVAEQSGKELPQWITSAGAYRTRSNVSTLN
jgi:hypothetical protein